MLTCRTHGNAFDRGRQQGAACVSVACHWIEPALKKVAKQLSANQVGAEVARLRRQIERVYPEGYAEYCGVARGLNMNEADYFTAAFHFRLAAPACSVVAVRTPQNNPVLGKTDDVLRHELGVNILEYTAPERGYHHAHFHFAGSIWTVAGINERGLAMVMTGIPGPRLNTDGFLSLDALHRIMPACATTGEAETCIRELSLNIGGFSLLLGDATGNLQLIEKTGAGMTRVPGLAADYFAHTNHILDASLAIKNPVQVEPLLTNSQRRYYRLAQLVRTSARSVEGLQQILFDRGGKGPIQQRGEDGLFTDFTVLFLPEQRQFKYWSGFPECQDSGWLDFNGCSM